MISLGRRVTSVQVEGATTMKVGSQITLNQDLVHNYTQMNKGKYTEWICVVLRPAYVQSVRRGHKVRWHSTVEQMATHRENCVGLFFYIMAWGK